MDGDDGGASVNMQALAKFSFFCAAMMAASPLALQSFRFFWVSSH